MNNHERIEKITRLLTDAFQPAKLLVEDESAHHIGHAGAQSGAGHFAIQITAAAFQGKSLVTSHRMIYGVLDELIPNDIHALKIKILDLSMHEQKKF